LSINRSVNQLTSQSINQSIIDQSIYRPVNQSTRQSIDQSINELTD
jgi:hypothetical protein